MKLRRTWTLTGCGTDLPPSRHEPLAMSVASAPSTFHPAGADGSNGRNVAATRSPACFSCVVSTRGKHDPPTPCTAVEGHNAIAATIAANIMGVSLIACDPPIPAGANTDRVSIHPATATSVL